MPLLLITFFKCSAHVGVHRLSISLLGLHYDEQFAFYNTFFFSLQLLLVSRGFSDSFIATEGAEDGTNLHPTPPSQRRWEPVIS